MPAHATNRRHRIDPVEIRRLYLDEAWTMARLVRHYGCAETTIKRRLEELDVAPRPRGPRLTRQQPLQWSATLAYAVGLITTDGNLSPDGRHLSFTSKDVDQIVTLRECLQLRAAIMPTGSGLSRDGEYHRLQWGDRALYAWLVGIGLSPAKSLRLGALSVPDEWLADFVRGCIDGDGSIVTYTNRYNTYKSEKYVYTRLMVSIVSASSPFLEWLHGSIRRVNGARGAIMTSRLRPDRAPIWKFKFSKKESIRLLRWIHYSPAVPCLARKRYRASAFLSDVEASQQSGHNTL